MIERAEMFGEHRTLLGIVTEPEDRQRPRPAVVLLNAGLMHRIGPFRLYVLLARALAKLGFTVLRFDLSSKGDSPARPGMESYREAVRADVRDALDFLQTSRGLDRFILLGLCSGADDAFIGALGDNRVSGLALLDGYAYRTLRFYLRHYLPRLRSAARWRGFARRLLDRSRSGAAEVDDDVFGMAFPPKAQFAKGLRELLARKASVLVVHSAGWFEYYNYANQFRDAFPGIARDSAVTVRYFDKADHTYTIASDRRKLVEAICAWADASFR